LPDQRRHLLRLGVAVVVGEREQEQRPEHQRGSRAMPQGNIVMPQLSTAHARGCAPSG
jgi:hypothetical protein